MSKSDFQTVIQRRMPAPQTLEFIEETRQKFTTYEISMNNMTNQIKNLDEKIDTIIVKLDCIDGKYAGKWTERWIVAITLLFALSALYFIFKSVGLPYINK